MNAVANKIDIDSRIAEHVMGWTKMDLGSDVRWYDEKGRYVGGGTYNPVPRYSSDLTAAMEVVEKMRSRDNWSVTGYGVAIQNSRESGNRTWSVLFEAMLSPRHPVGSKTGSSESLPMAICLAAMAIVDQEAIAAKLSEVW